MTHRLPPLLLLAAFGACLLGLAALRFVDATIPNLTVESDGHFVANGRVPGELPGPSGLRYWSSWDGDDAHRGAFTCGPFPAPRALVLFVRGYPKTENNRLALENVATGESIVVPAENPGETWRRTRISVPTAWYGAPMQIRAIDDAEGWGGWLALSEPREPSAWTAWWEGVWPPLGAALFCGLAVALVFTAVGALLGSWKSIDGSGRLIMAGAATAALGYAVFWAYLAHPGFGAILVGMVYVGVAVVCFGTHRRIANDLWRDREWLTPALLMTSTVLLGAALLFLFSTDRLIPDLAQNRYREGLPGDNDIPHFFADRLRAGQSLIPFFGDWLSSDRPPLQTGWTLLFAPAAGFLGIGTADGDHLVAFWFQSLWIPAVWWWLRSLAVRRRLAATLIAVVAPSGFFIINSVYVWPKLAAGALAIGAFTAWFITRSRDKAPLSHFACGGGLAALAWLAHGGVAFSFLAMVPFAILDWRRERWKHWLAAGTVFLSLAIPWLSYQKFYDPPGNRLLKWHLAGVIPPDERGTLETLTTAYREASWSDLWQNRVDNAHMLFTGSWRQLLTFDTRAAQARRDLEFFHTFFALGWWNAGFAAVVALAIVRIRTRIAAPVDHRFGLTLAWLAGTLVVWVALMFSGWTTAIHQGSYAVLILLFPVLALALWRVHWTALVAVLAAQYSTYPALWMSPPPAMAALSMRSDAMAAVLASVTMLLLVALRPDKETTMSAQSGA